MKGLEAEHFSLGLQVEEPVGSLEESAAAGVGEREDLVQDFSEEAVAIHVLSLWHRDALVVVQLLEPDLFGDEEELFDVDVGVY